MENKNEELEQLFLSLTKNLIRKFDFEKEPNIIYFHNENGNVLFKQYNKRGVTLEDYPNGMLNFNGNIFWDEFKINSDDTKTFLSNMMQKHFKFNMDGVYITAFGEVPLNITIDLKDLPKTIHLKDYVKKDESNSPL